MIGSTFNGTFKMPYKERKPKGLRLEIHYLGCRKIKKV